MNTIHCRIKLNDHADVAGKSVTPAEVIVLRHLHDKHAGGCCIKLPRVGGEALMRTPDGKTRPRTSIEEYQRLRAKYPQRSAPDKPNSSFLDDLFPGVATGAVQFPSRFEQLPPQYALKDEIAPPREKFLRTEDVHKDEAVSSDDLPEPKAPEPEPVNPVLANPPFEAEQPEQPPKDAPAEALGHKTKAELLEIAGDYGLDVTDKATKADLVAAIQAAQQPRQVEAAV